MRMIAQGIGIPKGHFVAAQPSLTSPDMLVLATIGMLLTYVWKIQIFLGPALAQARLALIFTVLATTAWVFSAHQIRSTRTLLAVKPARLAGLLGVMVLLSIVFGAYPRKALEYTIDVHLSTFLLLVLTAASIRHYRDIHRHVMAALLGGLTYTAVVLARFSVDATGRLASLYSYDANDFAMVLVCSLPLAAVALRPGATKVSKLIGILALVVFMTGLVRTGSRGGFLGLIAVVFFLLFRVSVMTARRRLVVVGLVVLALLGAGTDKYWELMSSLTTPTADYNFSGNSPGGRMEIWKRGVGYVAERPVFGWGINNFSFAEGQSQLNQQRIQEGKGWVWKAAHNSFLQAAVELGLLGALVFVWLIGATFRRLRPKGSERAQAGLREDPATRLLADSLAASLVGYCVSGFFLSQAYSPFLYWLLGLAIGLIKIGPQRRPQVGSTPKPGEVGRIAPQRPLGPPRRTSSVSLVGAMGRLQGQLPARKGSGWP